jgi:hypothetical protein
MVLKTRIGQPLSIDPVDTRVSVNEIEQPPPASIDRICGPKKCRKLRIGHGHSVDLVSSQAYLMRRALIAWSRIVAHCERARRNDDHIARFRLSGIQRRHQTSNQQCRRERSVPTHTQ